MIISELELLSEEHDCICTRFPRVFDLGILKLDATEFLDKIKSNIETYISAFKKCTTLPFYNKIIDLEEFLKKNLQKSQVLKDETTSELKHDANTIEDFIYLKQHVEDDSGWEEAKIILGNMLQNCEAIATHMDKFYVDYDHDTLLLYLKSREWLKDMDRIKRIAGEKIQAARPMLKAEQRQKNADLVKNLAVLNSKISKFQDCYNPAEIFEYNNSAKQIMAELDELERLSKIYVEYEAHLTMQISDFSEVGKTKEGFNKYYRLWDFVCEKWQIVSIIFKFLTD